MRAFLIVGLLCVVVSGCSPRLSGTYLPEGKGNAMIGNFLEKIEFVSGSEVDVTTFGQTTRSHYKVDGKKLVLTNGGQSFVLEIDDKGCIGNTMLREYC